MNGSGVVTTGQSKDWQKYKLTNDDGTRIYINKGNFTHIDNLNPGFYETVTTINSTQGMPVPTGVSGDNSYFEIDVWFAGSGRKQYKVRQSYNNRVWEKSIHTNGVDNGWKEIVTASDISTIETTEGSQAKATTAENNAKQYTDAKFAKRTNTIFQGTANGVGSPINLSETLDNFIVLYIYGDFPGGEFVSLGNPQGTRNISIMSSNLVGYDGVDGAVYECGLTKVNRQQLQITTDANLGIVDNLNGGANANKFTIQKIVGVYK